MDEDTDNSQDTSDLLGQYNDNHTWSNQVMGQFTWTEPLGNVSNGNFLTFRLPHELPLEQRRQTRLLTSLMTTNMGHHAPVTLATPTAYYLTTIELDPDYSETATATTPSTQNIRLGYKKIPKTQPSKQPSHWCRRCQSQIYRQPDKT